MLAVSWGREKWSWAGRCLQASRGPWDVCGVSFELPGPASPHLKLLASTVVRRKQGDMVIVLCQMAEEASHSALGYLRAIWVPVAPAVGRRRHQAHQDLFRIFRIKHPASVCIFRCLGTLTNLVFPHREVEAVALPSIRARLGSQVCDSCKTWWQHIPGKCELRGCWHLPTPAQMF